MLLQDLAAPVAGRHAVILGDRDDLAPGRRYRRGSELGVAALSADMKESDARKALTQIGHSGDTIVVGDDNLDLLLSVLVEQRLETPRDIGPAPQYDDHD